MTAALIAAISVAVLFAWSLCRIASKPAPPINPLKE